MTPKILERLYKRIKTLERSFEIEGELVFYPKPKSKYFKREESHSILFRKD